jgi:hypothetical protein
MSQLGQSRHSELVSLTSGLPRSTDITRSTPLVRFVPFPDSCSAASVVLFDHLVDSWE